LWLGGGGCGVGGVGGWVGGWWGVWFGCVCGGLFLFCFLYCFFLFFFCFFVFFGFLFCCFLLLFVFFFFFCFCLCFLGFVGVYFFIFGFELCFYMFSFKPSRICTSISIAVNLRTSSAPTALANPRSSILHHRPAQKPATARCEFGWDTDLHRTQRNTKSTVSALPQFQLRRFTGQPHSSRKSSARAQGFAGVFHSFFTASPPKARSHRPSLLKTIMARSKREWRAGQLAHG